MLVWRVISQRLYKQQQAATTGAVALLASAIFWASEGQADGLVLVGAHVLEKFWFL